MTHDAAIPGVRRVRVALGAVAVAMSAGALQASRTDALSIIQQALPAYACGTRRCPATPATSLLPNGGNLLATGIESQTAHVYTQVTLGSALTLTSGPAGSPGYALGRGFNGDPWALAFTGRLLVLDATPHGVATRYQYPVQEASPTGLTGGLGATWLVGSGVTRLNASGELTQIPLGPSPVQAASQIVAGPDESMWFTDGNGAIGQITAGGKLIEHSSEPEPLDPLRANPQPTGIAVGPDGALWYTDSNHGRIGRIDPAGQVQEFQIPNHSLPDAADAPQPADIVAGPEGRYMYFTDPGDNAIGRVSLAGEVTEYPIPSLTPVGPTAIVPAGGELVVAERNTPILGVVNPAASPGEAPLATPPGFSTAVAALKGQLTTAVTAARRPLTQAEASFAITAAPPEPGTLGITWSTVPPVATKRHSRKPKPAPAPVIVAKGEATFALAEPKRITVKLTSEGQSLLRQARRRRKRLTLVANASFNGYWAGAVESPASQLIIR